MTLENKAKIIAKNPKLWIETFVRIVDKTGKLVPFKLNPQQAELIKGVTKYNIILKSRQLGITSLALALMLYYTHTQPNAVCLIMGHTLNAADGIFKKLKQMYDDLPAYIKQSDVANNRKELTFMNGSRIDVQTCGAKQSSRGNTYKYIHISEAAFCVEENLSTQLLALEQALRPDGVMIIESTANGLNKFADMYMAAEKHDNMYKPFFFGWVQDKIMFAQEQAEFAQAYIDNNGSIPLEDDLDDKEKALSMMGATLQQIAWRRLKIRNSNESSFAQEFPSNPLEAFITTGDNVFSSGRIQSRINYIHEVQIQPIPIELMSQISRWAKSLDIYSLPVKGKRYYVGVDTSEGLGRDYSVFEILDADYRQVTEFKSNKIKAYDYASVINAVGRYYNNALLVIEKASAGHTVLDKLRNDYSYLNIYKHKDYDSRGNCTKKIGYVTNAKTRPTMINDFVELFETNQMFVNSSYLLSEMKVFTADNNGKVQAERGKHDDAIMAMAMAIQGVKSNVYYMME